MAATTDVVDICWWAVYASAGVALVGCGVGAAGARLCAAIWGSISPLPPTERQLREEQLTEHPLFRHFEVLRGKIAWRQIGTFPTPIHTVQATTADGASIQFFVKREDLASAKYGGNKVRTLQHQLAACEAHQEQCPEALFAVMGSYGSNQVVATKVHAASAFGMRPRCMEALAFLSDKPDLDNTLNLLSTLSLGGSVIVTPLLGVRTLLRRLWRASDRVFAPGGHNVTGVLGQIGACLELAEQIERGDVPDPAAIYLPYGSGCTTVGLIMGVALSRHLGLRAFRAPGFKIVAVIVHQSIAALHRRFGALFWPRVPFSISWSINAVCSYLASMGVPDLTQLCHQTRTQCLEIITDPAFVGLYGTHSAKSLPAAQAHDRSQCTTGEAHAGFEAGSTPLWLCGHFAAKPFALMAERLNGGEHTSCHVLFWQTKSHTQPLADNAKVDAQMKATTDTESAHVEALLFQQVAFPELKRWALKGKAYSEIRPGQWPDHYRHLMTKIVHPPD
jgi:1-aminocyclopropane-1-carboxylate deaminase/D-cysteine desulfhydrase-like pyridoxal-dependent ACC family enzyme